MIYSNDETDKAIRKRNYLLTVIALPVAVIIIVIATIYFLYNKNYINTIDRNYCYALSVSVATFLFAFNKRKWLKMPDGSYFRVQHKESRRANSFNEPVTFERAYYNSKSKKAIGVVVGVLLVTLGVYVYFKHITYLIPAVMIVTGLLSILQNIRGILDRSPKLQLSTKGLWTKKLGFVEWQDITKAQVIREGDSEHSRMILEVYLKNTVFAEANAPDERLVVTEIDDNGFIEIDIDHFSKMAQSSENND